MRDVSVPDSVFLAFIQSSRSDGGRTVLDPHAFEHLVRHVRLSGYSQPGLFISDDGYIECNCEPVNVKGKPAEVIRVVHRHGAITRQMLAREVWGNESTSDANIDVALSRARAPLRRHGFTIASLSDGALVIRPI